MERLSNKKFFWDRLLELVTMSYDRAQTISVSRAFIANTHQHPRFQTWVKPLSFLMATNAHASVKLHRTLVSSAGASTSFCGGLGKWP